jgi:hypothetical protein
MSVNPFARINNLHVRRRSNGDLQVSFKVPPSNELVGFDIPSGISRSEFVQRISERYPHGVLSRDDLRALYDYVVGLREIETQQLEEEQTRTQREHEREAYGDNALITTFDIGSEEDRKEADDLRRRLERSGRREQDIAYQGVREFFPKAISQKIASYVGVPLPDVERRLEEYLEELKQYGHDTKELEAKDKKGKGIGGMYHIKHVPYGYKVCKLSEKKCFSKHPLDLERAKRQMRALYLHTRDE